MTKPGNYTLNCQFCFIRLNSSAETLAKTCPTCSREVPKLQKTDRLNRYLFAEGKRKKGYY